MTSSFSALQSFFLVMKSGFSALQSFGSKVHTTPYRWSSPYDVPPKFMSSAQHWYTVQKELHTGRVLCSCQSWSQHQILRGKVFDLVPGLIIVCCDHIGFVMRQSGMDWTKHY